MSGAPRGGIHRRPQTFYSRKVPRPREDKEGKKEVAEEEKEEAGPSDKPRGVVARAQEDPDSLTSQEIMCLVRMVCAKASHEDGAAKVLANLCLTVIKKQRSSSDFAELLLEACSQWFIRREELLPRRLQDTGEVAQGADENEPYYKWTFFVAFVAELLAGTWGWRKARRHACPLAVLLCECCEIMLRCPAQDALDEMKCIRSALVVAGAAAESVVAQSVRKLVALMARASVDPKFPPEAKEVLLELIHPQTSARKPKGARNTTYTRQGPMRGKR